MPAHAWRTQNSERMAGHTSTDNKQVNEQVT